MTDRITLQIPCRGRLDDLAPPVHVIAEEYFFLRAHGEHPYQIAARLHMEHDTMLAMLRRHGIRVDADVIVREAR